MGYGRSQGISRHYRDSTDQGYGLGDAYQKSLDQMGMLNTISLNGHGASYDIRQDESRYTYDAGELKGQLNLDRITGAAEQLNDYGEQMFDLFDQYKPQYEYIAENAGVSGNELNLRLADSGARYNANYDAMMKEAERDFARMGVNPNSGRFAAMKTTNALGKAAGHTANQNQVRQNARAEDMNERLQAASLGLNLGNTAAGAVGNAAQLYGQAGQAFTDNKIRYDSLNESARQYDHNYALQQDQLKLGAQNQAFAQASDRFNKGVVQQIDNAYKPNQKISYKYGY